MDTSILLPLTIWHWLALALILFLTEMALGTFDLLMVAVAAALTAAWTGFAPADLAGWQSQLLVFFGVAITLIILGRTVFAPMRTGGPGLPGLNKRMSRLEGARGQVVVGFVSGQGRVRIGDTEWLAESMDGTDIPEGTSIIVEGARSTMVRVRAA